MKMDQKNESENNGLWIFGYGSLCWYPGFEYKKSITGHIRGFERRFWQGNTTHRGTIDKPGRVATLIESNEGKVYGRAFQIQDSSALPYLENRECSLGGYLTTFSNFYPCNTSKNFTVLVYIATNRNQHWLGEAPLHAIARQIIESSGPSGHNAEYLLRLADFMHRFFPMADDEHLFTLELLIRSRIKEENMCLKTIMGNREFTFDMENAEPNVNNEQQDAAEENEAGNRIRENSFQFVSKVHSATLRCLKM